MGREEQTIRPDRSETIRKAIIFVLSAALHIGGFLYILHAKYTYKIYKYPARGMAVIVLPEEIRSTPRFGKEPAGKPEPRKPGVIKPGREETGAADRATSRVQVRPGTAGGEQGAAPGPGSGGAGTGVGSGPGTGAGVAAPGFRLIYRKGAALELAKIKSDPVAELTRPERYQARPDINFAKYIRPNPLRPDALPAGGGRGAAGAVVAAKGGPVAAVAATPAGGVNVPDNIRRFDFLPWANEAMARVQKKWSLLPYGGGSWKGEVGILVMISKAGEILGAEIKVSSNVELLDQVALSALQTASPLPPLPEDFPNSSLELYLVFKYGY